MGYNSRSRGIRWHLVPRPGTENSIAAVLGFLAIVSRFCFSKMAQREFRVTDTFREPQLHIGPTRLQQLIIFSFKCYSYSILVVSRALKQPRHLGVFTEPVALQISTGPLTECQADLDL